MDQAVVKRVLRDAFPVDQKNKDFDDLLAKLDRIKSRKRADGDSSSAMRNQLETERR